MKFINLRSSSTPSELVSAISDNNFVNKNVNFGDSGIYPKMKVKEKNSRLSITCEMIGGPTRDNGFIVGTFFAGRIKKREYGSQITGIILTSPIYHLIVSVLIIVIILQSIKLNGINILPIFIVAFDILLFKKEFKKQGYIQRYLARAVARLEVRNDGGSNT